MTKATTLAYRRSHGQSPRRSGFFAFQRSSTYTALEADLYGEVAWYHGTLAAARKLAEQAHADAPYTALLP